MAVIVKGKPIKSTLQKAINYVADAYKTENKILVSTHGTSIDYGERDFLEVWNTNTNQQKKVLARHLKQSFAPGEVSPEEAHEIALEFCERFLKGEYQYVVGTHVDTNCIHNHILFNNIRMTDFKAYKITKDIPVIRQINDDICKEHGLSIIDPNMEKKFLNDHHRNTRSYYEDMCLKKGLSWKAKIQSGIDLCIEQATSYEDFLLLVEDIGLIYDDNGKYLKIKFPEQQKFTRCKEQTLGKDYTREAIQNRIEQEVEIKNQIENKPKMYMQDPNFIKQTKQKIQDDLNAMLSEEKMFRDFMERFSSLGYSYDPDEKVYMLEDNLRTITCPEARLSKKYHMGQIQAVYREADIDIYKQQFVDYKVINRTKYVMASAIKYASSYDDFLNEMRKKQYDFKEYRGELYLKYSSDEEFTLVHPTTFGTDYIKEMIRFNIMHKTIGQEDVRIIRFEKGLNQNEILTRNMTMMNENYLLLKKHGINSFSEITEVINFYNNIQKKNNDRIKEIKELTGGFLTDLKLKSELTDLYNDNRRLKASVANLHKIHDNYSQYLELNDRSKERLDKGTPSR